MRVDIDKLPNPHLGSYLPDDYEALTDHAKALALRIAHLNAAGLPDDYYTLSEDAQWTARWSVLSGWYDVNRPNVLCTDTEAFIRALFLWVEFYVKPNPENAAKYYFRDPVHKYQMVRWLMSDPITFDEPTKTVLHAPRGSTKTVTIIRQAVPMIAICRPSTMVTISEINQTRTDEEIRYIREEIETNELIHADFGDRGALWPKSNRSNFKWTDGHLDFCHMGTGGKSTILGKSTGSAMRGLHPQLGIIDDPENEDMARNPDLRQKFFDWLFGSYLPMFAKGNKLMWIGTTIETNSCLTLALRGRQENQDEIGQTLTTHDPRFDDWNRGHIDLLYEDDEGNLRSNFPDYITPEGFRDKERTLGKKKAWAELRGKPINSGDFAFQMDPLRHGYMVANDDDGAMVMLDIRTGKVTGYRPWLESLYVTEGVDLADTASSMADFSAMVTIGIDPDNTVFVLDASIKRQGADLTVAESLDLACQWKASRLGIEKGTMQNAMLRLASARRQEMIEQGMSVPMITPVNNAGRNKVQRILASLRPLVARNEIRLPRYEPYEDPNGKLWRPADTSRRYMMAELWDELDQFTEEGAGGHDDGIDALEMAIRMAAGQRGRAVVKKTENEAMVEEYHKAGISVGRHRLPQECWTEAMWKEYYQAMVEPVAVGPTVEIDPYN